MNSLQNLQQQIQGLIDSNIAIIIASLVGSTKALDFNKKTSKISNVVDFVFGLLFGIFCGVYLLTDFGFIIASMVALIASGAGVILVETFLGLLPAILRNWLSLKLLLKKISQ